MKSVLKLNQYVFRQTPDDKEFVTIVAPTYVEAVQAYHEVVHVEPFSVTRSGVCFYVESL